MSRRFAPGAPCLVALAAAVAAGGAPAESPPVEVEGRLSARYRLQAVERSPVEDETDQDVIASLHARAVLRELPLRPVDLVLDLDYVDDVDGSAPLGKVTGDLLNTYESGRYVFLRSAYADLRGALHPALDLRLGRQSVWSIVPVRFDGADAKVRLGRAAEVEAFAGRLHTFYASDAHPLVAGGEVAVRPLRETTLTVKETYVVRTNLFELGAVQRAGRPHTFAGSFLLVDETPWEARLRYDWRPVDAPLDVALSGVTKVRSLERWGRSDLELDYLRSDEEKSDLYRRWVLGYLRPFVLAEARATLEVAGGLGVSALGGYRRLYRDADEDAFNMTAWKAGAGIEARDLLAAGSRVSATCARWDGDAQAKLTTEVGASQEVAGRARLDAWFRHESGELGRDRWDGFATGGGAEIDLGYGLSLAATYQYEWSGLLEDLEGVEAWHRGTVEVRWDF